MAVDLLVETAVSTVVIFSRDIAGKVFYQYILYGGKSKYSALQI